MATQPPRPQEEYYENEGTHVEVEPEVESDDDLAITKPWDPDDIRVDSKTFSIRNILDMIDDGDLDLAPDFQRQLVWKIGQKSRLIESILLRIPLPAFYFTEERGGMMRVVDGLQRLSTIHAYVRGIDGREGFALKGLEYLIEVANKRFSDLATSWQRRLNSTQLFIHVIDPSTPDSVKFDIFKRINTGGSPLNAQEIRHCMSGGRSRGFLKRAASLSSFQRATDYALLDHVRMVDREVALRYFAFRKLGEQLTDYRQYESMDAFLTSATRSIDEEDDEARLQALLDDFDRAMVNAEGVFGDHAFRKWPLDSNGKNPINRALFESWAVALTDYRWSDLEPHRDEIRAAARALMTADAAYLGAISESTGDPRRVEARFGEALSVLRSIVR